VLVYGEAFGSAPGEFPCDFFKCGYMKDLVYSNGWKMLPQQFAITEVCWKEWKNRFVGAFTIVLTITAVTLNTSCNDF
jgi:hypothetical protein